MPARQPRYSKEEFARRGDEIYESQVRQQVEEGNYGKIVAIDLETGAFEVDANEIAACDRPHQKNIFIDRKFTKFQEARSHISNQPTFFSSVLFLHFEPSLQTIDLSISLHTQLTKIMKVLFAKYRIKQCLTVTKPLLKMIG